MGSTCSHESEFTLVPGPVGPGPESNPGESNIQSFIVKIWAEDAREVDGGPAWRGQVTHVPGGERRSFQDLEDLGNFIERYLERMGADTPARWWVHLSVRKPSNPASRRPRWLRFPAIRLSWKRNDPPSSSQELEAAHHNTR